MPGPRRARSDAFNLTENPKSETFFTETVYDKISVHADTLFSDLVKTLRETTEKVYIIPTHAAFTEVAKRFLRGELPVTKDCTR